MRIKDEVEQIIGRRISGVVIKRAKEGGHPTNQLFLLFDDGHYYEFYTTGCSISTTAGVSRGELNDVLGYMNQTLEPVFVKYQE